MILSSNRMTMVTELTHAERAERLLETPEEYEELVEAYDNGVAFYEKTRSKIPQITNSFEEYLSYYQIFINRGPRSYIYSSLERNTNRSIKNMLLGSSDAGQEFRIHTLNEAAQRVQDYQDLGVEGTSLTGVVTTLLEELYEEHPPQFTYPVLSALLNSVPDDEQGAIELVARAQLVTGIHKSHYDERILEELDQYLCLTNDPRPKDNRSADELIKQANNHLYSDPELISLYGAALHRDPSITRLSEYLYFSARDVVERYRHQGQKQPTVGELRLSENQFTLVQMITTKDDPEYVAYLQSYLHIARGIYESGRKWQSEQDPRKTKGPNFAKAAQEYLRAAAAIYGWNNERYIKYLTKSLRHAANATDSWKAKVEIHDCAVVVLIEASQQIDDGDVSDVLEESKVRHEFWSQVAESYTQIERNNPDDAHDLAVAAEEDLNKLEMDSSSYLLQRVITISECQILEQDGFYDDAVSRCADFDFDDEKIKARENIAQIKSYLEDGDLEIAKDYAQSEFGDNSVLTNAIRAIGDYELSSLRSHGEFPHDLFIRDTEAVAWRLQSLLSMYVCTAHFRDFLRGHIRIALINI